MYRSINLDKDTYIQNKIIGGSGSITSNVGNASTIDFFKIYTSPISSTTSASIELSRVLLHVNLDPIRSLTGSLINLGDSSFKAYLSMKDIYGGQTCPSNFTLSLFPLAKTWDEGRGFDIKAFRDLDSANWVTASIASGTPTAWAITGANGTGSLNASGIDIYVTGNLGAGSQSLEIKQTFARGDENLLMDVTQIVSATLVGIIPDYGWRLSYSSSLENDSSSYFVKRFGARNTTDPSLHPKLIFKFNEQLRDDGNQLVFGSSNTIRTYKIINGTYTNFFSGSTEITGNNCAKLILIASKSLMITTSSYQTNFSASITYQTSSISYFSSSFNVSSSMIGNHNLPGYYQSTVLMNPQTTSSLANFIAGMKNVIFQSFWTSNDGTVLYGSGSWLNFKVPEVTEQVVSERNFILNVINLKNFYTQNQVSRMRVFVQDRNTELPVFRMPTPSKSLILSNMCWRLIEAFSKKEVIPFDSTYTLLSYDGVGMYFDLYIQDLDSNMVYELEFLITENGRDYYITDNQFRFKVTI